MVRIITFSHHLAHTQPLFLSVSILPLDKLFLNQIVMYKYLYVKITLFIHITLEETIYLEYRETLYILQISVRVYGMY